MYSCSCIVQRVMLCSRTIADTNGRWMASVQQLLVAVQAGTPFSQPLPGVLACSRTRCGRNVACATLHPCVAAQCRGELLWRVVAGSPSHGHTQVRVAVLG